VRKSRSGDEVAVHAFLPASRANGPGLRAVVWVQGCTLACPGCFNPETHARDAAARVAVDELFERIAGCAATVEGLTITGGEPLQQRKAVLSLLERVRSETALSTVLFSGFSRDEIERMPDAARLLASIDVLIAGRYVARQRLARGLRGSESKTIHLLSDRYALPDVDAVPAAEVLIDAAGDVVLTGIDPLEL
jgi:anaerobic ribonucleoside-triphosphate reductase activating protein